MLVKPDSTTTNSPAAMPAATACGNCGVEERRLLHHVRHRGVFRRLCTTCVLRFHPQSFCPTCFQVYPLPPSNDAVLTCVKCYSSSHSHCVEAGPSCPSPYICPLCLHPNVPIFKLKSAKEANAKINGAMNVGIDDCRVMDRDAAKMMLAASKIASASMNKAAVGAKAEAERRAKEAAYTRKRAKEALEHVAHLVMKEKLRKKEAALAGPGIGGIGHAVKMERENNVNVSNSNRNGIARFNDVEEKLHNAANVDRDNSNQVLAALNAVELKESVKMGGRTVTPGVGEASSVLGNDDRSLMDVDEKGIMTLNAAENADAGGMVGEWNNDSSNDHVNITDIETGVETLNAQEEKQEEDVNNEVVMVQTVMHQTQGSNSEEQHANGGSL